MSNLTRILAIFFLSAAFFTGCGPNKKKQQEASAAALASYLAAEKIQEQKNDNDIIVKIIALSQSVTTHLGGKRQGIQFIRNTCNYTRAEAHRLGKDYKGLHKQDLRRDLDDLFEAAYDMWEFNDAPYHPFNMKPISRLEGSTTPAKCRDEYTELLEKMKGKYQVSR